MGDAPNASRRYTDLPDSDAACVACGYNLRGQRLTGVCPECGLAVAASAARVADRMAGVVAATGAADDHRLSDLRAGPWLLLAAWGLALAAGAVERVRSAYDGDAAFAATLMSAVAWVLGVAGILVGTWAAPGAVEPAVLRGLRAATRLALWVAAAILVTLVLLDATGAPTGTRRGRDEYRPLSVALTFAAAVASGLFWAYRAGVAWLARSPAMAAPALLVAVALLLVVPLKAYLEPLPPIVARARTTTGGEVGQRLVLLPTPGVGYAVPSPRWNSVPSPDVYVAMATTYVTPVLLFQLALTGRRRPRVRL